jgi:hypothetical protein
VAVVSLIGITRMILEGRKAIDGQGDQQEHTTEAWCLIRQPWRKSGRRPQQGREAAQAQRGRIPDVGAVSDTEGETSKDRETVILELDDRIARLEVRVNS